MKKYPPFYFLAAASYFSALMSLFLLNIMFLAKNFYGQELLIITVILAIKNPVFFSLTLPWWWTMICYWRQKFTMIGMLFLGLGLTYYLFLIIKILILSLNHFIACIFILAWSLGAFGALALPLILQSYLQGYLEEKLLKKLCFLVNIFSAITIASFIFSIRI